MPDYSKGKIYKIVCDDEPHLVYYGSTCEALSCRMAAHRAQYRQYTTKAKGNNITSYQIMKYESAIIILVENYPCKNKEELNARERHWIDTHPCVNKNRPGAFLTKGVKQYHADYRTDNAEKIQNYQTEYRKINAEAIKAKRPKYAAKAKEYYAAHKAQIIAHANQKVQCECGGEYSYAGKTQHYRTAKHARKMKQKAINDEIAEIMLIDAYWAKSKNNINFFANLTSVKIKQHGSR